MKHPFLFIINILIGILLPTAAFASACCGGNFSGPSLITGDDKAMISPSLSYGEIRNDVEASGLWRKRDQPETIETFSLQASHVFWDRWQAGASASMIKRARQGETSSGLGDVMMNLGYEYLPDWDYHPIRPKGIGYLQLVIPTGKSIQESESLRQLDARGRGFWALGLGTMLTKNFSVWDVFSSWDLHRSFEKNYSNSQGSGKLKPGWGGAIGLGGGFHFGAYRLGTALVWNYEDPVDVDSATVASKGSPQRFVSTQASLSYAFENEWSASLQYNDQSLIGSPQNTTLTQSLLLEIQKRWLR